MRKITAIMICISTVAGVCIAGEELSLPLVPPSSDWKMNDYCKSKKIGSKDFYLAAAGSWSFRGEQYTAAKSLGIDRMITPGLINVSEFDPSVEKSEDTKRLLDLYIKNQWPFWSCEYHVQNEKARTVTAEAMKIAGDLWLGDGHAEYRYRFESFLPSVRGEKSTWCPWEYTIMYNQKYGIPLLDKELPFFKDKKHLWTRSEYTALGRIQMEVTFREIGLSNANAFTTNERNNTFFYLTSLNRTVGEKVHTYLGGALCRGAMRQFGGNKFWMLYGPNEPTGLLSSHVNTSNINYENGYPYSHARIFVYQPYLAGINYYLNEGFSKTLFWDLENDGHYELSALGHLVKEMFDFTQRHPNRGITYTPVALLMDWERTTADRRTGTTFGTYLPMDDADQMNDGIFELLFPQAAEGGGDSYLSMAPYGDIFDILKPIVPGKGVDSKALENYKVLFAMGGQTINQDLAAKIETYVKKGGTLIVNAEDVGKNLSADMLGVELLPETFEVADSACAVCGKKFTEPLFSCRRMKLRNGATAVVTSMDGQPIVSKYSYGKGSVIVIGAQYMVGKMKQKQTGVKWEKKPLLHFSRDLIEHLCSGLLPVDVVIPEETRCDFGYSVSKKGNGWILTLINFSYEKESVSVVKHGTASVDAICLPKKVPVKIICRFPVTDALEWMEDRDVPLQREGNATVINTILTSGDIKVIEMQPEKIELKAERYVNYALNRPVTTTSEMKGHEGKFMVDGDMRRMNGWWSKSERPDDRANTKLPASSTIDLETERMIDHVEVLFSYWQRERLEKFTYPWYTQFYVATSLDGNNWDIVFDERKNMKCNMGYPLERYFDAKKARYVKLTTTYDSLERGAMVVELKVTGLEKETYVPSRLSIPQLKIEYPASVQNVSESNLLYLIDIQPTRPPVMGWMPAQVKWETLNGPVKLLTSTYKDGQICFKSLYAEAPSEIVYKLPRGYATFVATAGLGAERPDDAVIFKVFLDGKEKYKSPLYQLGNPVLPVVVDVQNAQELKLVVDDSNGKISAYSWWGDARLIKNTDLTKNIPSKTSDKIEYDFAGNNLHPGYSDKNRTKLTDGIFNGPWVTCVGWRETKPCAITFTFPKENIFSKVKIFTLGANSGGGIGTPQYIRVYSGDKVSQDKLIGEINPTAQKKGWIEIPVKSGVSSSRFTIDIGPASKGDKDFQWIMISEVVFE